MIKRGYALRAVWLTATVVLIFGSGGVFAETRHVHVVRHSVRDGIVDAVGDRGKVPVQSRSIEVRITHPTGKTVAIWVMMLYEPSTKWFWWTRGGIEYGWTREDWDKNFAKSWFVGVADNGIVSFPRSLGAITSDFYRSSERYESLQQGEREVLRQIETWRGHPERLYVWPRKRDGLDKEIPREFFRQCFSAAVMSPNIENLSRVEGHWELTIRGPNGNSAVVTLNDNDEVVSTKLIPRPPVKVVSQSEFPNAIKAQRGWFSATLPARELRLELFNGCSLPGYANALLLYDPGTGFTLPIVGQSEDSWSPAVHQPPHKLMDELGQDSTIVIVDDKIVAFNFQQNTITESTSRFDSLQAAQQALLDQIAKQGVLPSGGRYGLPLAYAQPDDYLYCDAPPLQGCARTSRISRLGNGDWRFKVEGRNGATATVVTNANYEPVRTDVRFPRRREYKPLVAYDLFEAIATIVPKQIARKPIVEISAVVDESSTVRALAGDKPRKLRVLRIDVVNDQQLLIGRLLAIFEPLSRLFWCIYERPGHGDFSVDEFLAQLQRGDARLIVDKDRIVGFSGIGTGAPSTHIQQSTLLFASIGEGLAHVLAAISYNRWIYDGERTVELAIPGALRHFYDGKTYVYPRLRFTDIRPDGSGWRLQVDGAKGGQATIVLDENYHVLRASIVFGK